MASASAAAWAAAACEPVACAGQARHGEAESEIHQGEEEDMQSLCEVPEVELQQNPELLLQPTHIVLDDDTSCLIEASINSVRVSFRMRGSDELEHRLVLMYARFLMQHADDLDILRRVPVPGYDLSLLITHTHVMQHGRTRLAQFVAGLAAGGVAGGAHDLELVVRSHGRSVAAEFLRSLAF